MVSQLRAAVNGAVIAPGEAAYDKARTVFLGSVDRRPAANIRAADAADVVRVVSLARETGVELAVRSGGHSWAGHSVSEGGIVLDLHDLARIDIDVEHVTAWAGAGLTAGEFAKAAGAHGLGMTFGDSASVGIGGSTLGGGVGLLARKYGLTIDNLLAAEIVTADGEMLRADAVSHPDLFWAIRGGGGNFGVVTRFKFHLHHVDTIVGGMLFLPATPDTLAAFITAADAAPDELTTIVNIMPAPSLPFLPEAHHGQLVIFALMCYAGDEETGQGVLAPFRSLATPIADRVRPMRYPELFLPEEPGFHPKAVARTMFLNTIDRDVAESIVDYLEASEGHGRVTLRVLGGAVARVPLDATAYAHRQSPIMLNLVGFYEAAEEQTARQLWLEQFAADLDQGNRGAYVNFLSDEGPERVHAAYPGATWERLAAVKRRYDPGNLFRLNQNITPEN